MDQERKTNGRFAVGNKLDKGNPYAARVAKLRAALLDAVKDDDAVKIIQSLLEKSQKGDLACAKLILSYALGQPSPFEPPDEAIRRDQRVSENFW